MAPMLPSIITKLFGWAVALFYDVERTGPGLVPGPVLVTPNHPNMGVDALVVFHTGGRQTRWLGKAPLFEQHQKAGTDTVGDFPERARGTDLERGDHH